MAAPLCTSASHALPFASALLSHFRTFGIAPREATPRRLPMAVAFATRRGHKQATTSMIEKLPLDLMTRVLEFSDIPERLQLARGSKLLLKLITKDCTALWKEIVFYHSTCSKNSVRLWRRLTDQGLAALLTRVNAVDITSHLNLAHCEKIRGWGLAPLLHSRVIERVNIDTDPFLSKENVDYTTVTDILRTTLPYELFEVQFKKLWKKDDSTSSRTEFLRDLRAAKHRRAQEKRITCACCPSLVSDESRQVVPGFQVLPSTRCLTCHNHFCRTSSCDVSVLDCCQCASASCEDCNKVRVCNECTFSFCSDCRFVSPVCGRCDFAYCEDCDDNVETCSICELTACTECRYSGEETIEYCSVCEKVFCQDCRKVEYCEGCDDCFCSQCREVKQCEKCTASLCGRHLAGKCESCNKTVCEDCCSDLYSSDTFCHDCDESFEDDSYDGGPYYFSN